MDKKRYDLFCSMIESFDKGISLSEEYDSLLHDYNGVIMYQAESLMVKAIGTSPGITASELAEYFKQTASAVSQLIRKLKAKGWVRQERNIDNNRIWNLFLTDEGEKIYITRQKFENKCYMRSFEFLSDFSEEELKIYIAVQERLNESFQMDVEESKKFHGEYVSKKDSQRL